MLPGWVDQGSYKLTEDGVERRVEAASGDSLVSVERGRDFSAATPAFTSAQNKSHIDTAIAARVADGGGVVELNRGGTEVKTDGGHEISTGITVAGLSRHATKIIHRGSSYCFRLMDETNGTPGCGLKHVRLIGADGSNPAIQNAVGVELGNGMGFQVEDVWIDGFTWDGKGIYIHNTNTGSAVEFSGNHHLRAIWIKNCAKQLVMKAEAGADTAFGYEDMYGIDFDLSASQVAIEMGVGTFYNSHIFGKINYGGNNAIGIDILTGGEMKKGVHLHILGEMGGAFTGCKRIRSVGAFSGYGRFYVVSYLTATHQPPDETTGLFDFREEPMTWAEFNPIDNNSVASAAQLVIPSSGTLIEVTGTTTITSIVSSWEGRIVTLKFAGILTFTDGGNLKLNGNFVTSADDTITLAFREGTWYEMCRSAN